MGRIFMMVAGVVAVATALTINTSVAMAKPRPVSAVIKHGIYKAIVVCPRWNGPLGGPAPLLAAPPRKADPKPGRHAPQPSYTPLLTCTVTFLKDAPAALPQDKGDACSPASGPMSARPARVVRTCCVAPRHAMRFTPSCVLIETGFGGMARQVARHKPAVPRHRRS